VRVHDLPRSGRVVLAHPDDAAAAEREAEREGCDWMPVRWLPQGDHVYVLDVDAAGLFAGVGGV
jgi:hypothetical protein